MNDVFDGAMRGTVAAMAMTGMRTLTVSLGLVKATPPLLGLPHARSPRLLERAATAADHLLYGFVLAETKRIPTY